MSDEEIRRLLERRDGEPDDTFLTGLRARLERELEAGTTVVDPGLHGSRVNPEQYSPSSPMPTLAAGRRRALASQRWVRVALASAAAVVVLAGSAVVLTRHDTGSDEPIALSLLDHEVETNNVIGSPVPQMDFPEIAPGRYLADRFAVAFTLTTSKSWHLTNHQPANFTLTRGPLPANPFTELAELPEIELFTNFTLWSGTTTTGLPVSATTAINACPEMTFSTPVPTTLFGAPAVQVTGNSTTDTRSCMFAMTAPGATVEVTVGTAAGNTVIVVASAPTADWDTYALEATSLRESLQVADRPTSQP